MIEKTTVVGPARLHAIQIALSLFRSLKTSIAETIAAQINYLFAGKHHHNSSDDVSKSELMLFYDLQDSSLSRTPLCTATSQYPAATELHYSRLVIAASTHHHGMVMWIEDGMIINEVG